MMNNDVHHHFELGSSQEMLTIDTLVQIARHGYEVAGISPAAQEHIRKSADWVRDRVTEIEAARMRGEEHLDKIKPYYGINTGFGALADKRTVLESEYLMKVLTRNLIVSHSIGAGAYFDEETVRAAMLIRAQTLAQGYSGVRVEIIQKLIDMLNHRIYPAVPSKGSLGASGDLAPLSHLALVISKPLSPDPLYQITEVDQTSGEAFVPVCPGDEMQSDTTYHITHHHVTDEQTVWQRVSGEAAMEPIGGQIELSAKEGLALNNGATFSAAVAALTLYNSINLLENAVVALAMSLEAIRGFRDPFFPEVHRVRGFAGAQAIAKDVLGYVRGSKLLDPGDRDKDPKRVPPQDPYSFRCAPQVLGSVWDALNFVRTTVEIEMNAATDNPLIFMDLPRGYKSVSGGNFHGEPIAMAMDFLGIAVTELGNIAERRVFKLTDYHIRPPAGDEADGDLYELDDFLIKEPEIRKGLSSGFMIAQYTAASLISDCKTLAHPDSVDSIPSSANKEDHVSMSLNAARHAREIVDNVESVVAIELLCASQALSLRQVHAREKGRKDFRLGIATQAVLERIRQDVDYLSTDRALYPDLRKMLQLVRSGELVRIARSTI